MIIPAPRRHDFAVLTVGNHCLNAPKFRNGLPQTTKGIFAITASA